MLCMRKDYHQQNFGFNASGTRLNRCGYCGKTYALNPKSLAYDNQTRELAIKIYFSVVSGREVGKIYRMKKANVYN